MQLFRIRQRQRLPISIGEAWAFFSDPRNLELITPPSLGLRVTSELPERIYPGAIITYEIRPLLGIRMKWVTEITHLAEGRLFIDEQRFGPYRFWHHQHHFGEIGGGVEVRDLVHYALPGGPFGKLSNKVLVSRQLKEIFDFRRGYLERRYGSLPCDEAM